MKYDKPRLTSTIILGIFLTILLGLGLLWMFLFNWHDLKANSAGEAVGEIFFAILFVPFYFIAIVVNGILAAICLIFTIKNRKSTVKAIRILSYVMDAVVAVIIALSVIKISLLIVGF